jgi:hypothetical protein
MGTDPTPPGQPEPLIIMPAAGDLTPEQVAEFKVRLEAAMANPWRARTEAAEAKLAAIRVSARDSGRIVATHPDDGTYAAKEISFAAGSSRSLAEIIAAFERSNHLGSKEKSPDG